jgi:hypothetical protein
MDDRGPNVRVEVERTGVRCHTLDHLTPRCLLWTNASPAKAIQADFERCHANNLVNYLCPGSTSTIISEQGSDDESDYLF